MIGVGLFFGLNILLGVLFSFFSTMVISALPVATSSTFSWISNGLGLVLAFLPFVIDILLIIYFGLTRYWIALGMLGGFAIALLIVLLLGAVCFALIYGVTTAGQ